MIYPIQYKWDDDAKVWIATSDKVDGLVLESESLETLIKEVAAAVPELIDLNKLDFDIRMAKGMDDAKAKKGRPMEDVFDDIIRKINDCSDKEQ